MMKLKSLIEKVLTEVEGDLYYTPLNEMTQQNMGGLPNNNPAAATPAAATSATTAPAAATPATATPAATDTSTEADAKSVQDFLGSKIQEINDLWKQQYKSSPPLNLQEIKNAAYLAAKNSERTTAKSDDYVNLVNTFPLLDIAAKLKEDVFSKGKKGKPEDAEKVFTDWKTYFKSNSGTFPLDYKSDRPWANSVKLDYYNTKGKEADVGEGRIERMNQEFGLYTTIATLMEFRRKTWWNNLITREKNIKPGEKKLNLESFMNDLLIKYAKVESGLPVRDEKIKKAFGDDSTRLFLNVSQAAYQYFRSEVEKVMGKQDASMINAVINNEKFYAELLSKGSVLAKTIEWDRIPSIGEKFKDPEQAKQLREMGVMEKKQYSLKTIKAEAEAQNPFAKKLYESLLAVANHVRTKASFDLGKALDTANATMKAIGLGVI